jgi:predicted negative regulator of RcsB-dependent stress response
MPHWLNWLNHFNNKLDQILINQEKIMSTLSDLQTEVAALNASFSAELSAITAALSAARGADGSVSAADVEAVVVQLKTLQDSVDQETAALAPVPPPAAPPIS